MNKNIRYVPFKTEAERDRLIAEYAMYGYNIKVRGDRLVVNSKWPKKKKESRGIQRNEEGERNGTSEGRSQREKTHRPRG